MTTSTVLLATRKGLVEVVNDVVVALHFAGESVSQILVDSRDSSWYAALNLGHFGIKLKHSTDRGNTWHERSAPALPIKPISGPMAEDQTTWNVELIWSLVQGGIDLPGELWAGTIPGALFRSIDHGATWELNQSLWNNPLRREWFGGGYDNPGIHTVLVNPDDPNHVILAISSGGLWRTLDRGQTWRLIGHGQTADFLPPEQANVLHQQDPHCLAQCKSKPSRIWEQHHSGQYVSCDGAQTMQPINKGSGFDFGFAVAADPHNPERAWFVPGISDEKRYPKNNALCVLRTDDGGKTFAQLRSGLPQTGCFDLIYRHSLIVDNTGKKLAMASTTGHFWTSENAGDHWQQSQLMLPPVYSLSFA
jgi:hypothetical protein